ncbi:hypothetical protein JGC56_10820 [Salmonella enterica subsp. enterica serovar Saintpaul]|nr:hypothetical protein [Salmonella enterica subsp. enterica serovar Saintpaul]
MKITQRNNDFNIQRATAQNISQKEENRVHQSDIKTLKSEISNVINSANDKVYSHLHGKIKTIITNTSQFTNLLKDLSSARDKTQSLKTTITESNYKHNPNKLKQLDKLDQSLLAAEKDIMKVLNKNESDIYENNKIHARNQQNEINFLKGIQTDDPDRRLQ